MFTGYKDVDFLILNKLSDYELGKVCQVNKYVNSLCKDESFWRNRIMKTFDLDTHSILKSKQFFEFNTFNELYVYLKKEYDSYERLFYDERCSFEANLKLYLSYQPEIEKLFDLITYPAWVIKKIFQKEEKRNLFFTIYHTIAIDEFIDEFTNSLFDIRDFEWRNNKTNEFIAKLNE